MKGQYGNYIKMVRKNLDKERWLNLSQYIWGRIEENLSSVGKAYREFAALSLDLTESFKMEVKEFQGSWYVCFCAQNSQDDKVYLNRINLNKEEWDNLLKGQKKLSKLIIDAPSKKRGQQSQQQQQQAPKSTKRAKVPEADEEISMYYWSDSSASSPFGFYTEADCITHHERTGESGEDPIILCVKTKKPEKFFWLSQVLIYVIVGIIKEFVRKECEACDVDDPSQFAHMEGCMGEWQQKVDMYFEKAKKNVSTFSLVTYFNIVMSHLSLTDTVNANEIASSKVFEQVKASVLYDTELDEPYQYAIKQAILK